MLSVANKPLMLDVNNSECAKYAPLILSDIMLNDIMLKLCNYLLSRALSL